jgi:hypothetical protein
MVQELIVFLLFALALFYIGKQVYTSFKPKNGFCSKGCSGCSALDMKKLAEQLKASSKV